MTGPPREMAATLRLIEHTNGPAGEDTTAGWIALVDDTGVELWRTWITPVPNEIWDQLARAAHTAGNP